MSRGPLNRLIGTLGLLALVPTAVMSATGTLTATDTAMRAGATLLLAIAVRKLAAWFITVTAASFEKQLTETPDDSEAGPSQAPPGRSAARQQAREAAGRPPAEPPQRRRSDLPEAEADLPDVEVTVG